MANFFQLDSNGNFQIDGSGNFYFADTCCCGSRPTVGCNSCDPALYETYTVTLTGLGGDLSSFNGAHTLTNIGGCLWSLSTGGILFTISYFLGAWKVVLTVLPDEFDFIRFSGSADTCTVEGSYSYDACSDGYSLTFCSASSGASAVVS